jgi:molybdopterin synthase catalytic subunit
MFQKPKRALIQVEIHLGPLKKCGHKAPEGVGAKLIFTGIVRPDENKNGKLIFALYYEVVRPLAEIQLRRLATSMAKKYGLQSVVMQHSEGIVPVGQPSFRLIMSATHRAELFGAMSNFIDEMKRFVAIDKYPVY